MAQEEQLAALATLLTSYQAFITYQPLRTEVTVFDFLTLPTDAAMYEIPPRASLDPLEEVTKARERVGVRETVILIPGRSFDAIGTRHGQGGGWYDRFLAEAPRTWLRIGFCFEEQFSAALLKRESWDQAMDYVVAVNRENKTFAIYSSEGDTPT